MEEEFDSEIFHCWTLGCLVCYWPRRNFAVQGSPFGDGSTSVEHLAAPGCICLHFLRPHYGFLQSLCQLIVTPHPALEPGSSQYKKKGCSRFPPSCSGTPATSVCCSSPGLGSFLRQRSAASWARRIGRRTETGTCFNKPERTGARGEPQSGGKESPRVEICAVVAVV